MSRYLLLALVAVSLVVVAAGCSIPRSPCMTGLYTNVSDGMLVNPGDLPATPLKVGEASASSIIGICTGDCSIDTARKNGQIKKIYYVDYFSKGFLGVYGSTTTKVYGE